MSSAKPDHPYFEAWLRRTRKQLHTSGSLSQVAHVLATEDGCPVEEWRVRLRNLLDGRIPPTFELLARIESLVSKSAASNEVPEDSQRPLL